MTPVEEMRQAAAQIAEWSFVEASGATSQVLVSELNVAGRIARDWLRLERQMRERVSEKDE